MLKDLTEKELKQLQRNKKYWGERTARIQQKLTAKSIKETEKQLAKYYSNSMANVIGQFEKTYNKLLSTIEEGRNPTPADLYKLDTYWKMQGQLKQELQKLGENQLALMGNSFVAQYQNIYDALAIEGEMFNEIDRRAAEQMINQIWCADGQTWSNRVWKNVDRLQQTLNEGLLDCVVTGKKASELKAILQERFGVSYSGADMIVRTEMAHLQTQAAKQRYTDAGVSEVEILADKDERQCDICGKLHKQRFPIGAQVPIPAHPRCRCCIVPVID